jgi:putative tricarboxylic transport membrane protein
MIGALMIQGIQPGPQAMLQRPELFWGIVASMWIGNLFLLLLNLPLVGLWVRLLAIPYRLLFPAILMFCCIGVYSINNNPFDLFQLVVFSALGYVLLKLGCEPAPLILGLVLGPMMEEYLRRALLISLGDPMVLVTSPLSAAFLIAALVLLLSIAVPVVRAQREATMEE